MYVCVYIYIYTHVHLRIYKYYKMLIILLLKYFIKYFFIFILIIIFPFWTELFPFWTELFPFWSGKGIYDSELWFSYRHHLSLQERFHQHCLRSILNIHRRERITNTVVLEKAKMSGIIGKDSSPTWGIIFWGRFSRTKSTEGGTAISSPDQTFSYSRYNCVCLFRIGLIYHERAFSRCRHLAP